MEKDSLKDATCELIAEAKKTNAMLEAILNRMILSPKSKSQEDEAAFWRYWDQVQRRWHGREDERNDP